MFPEPLSAATPHLDLGFIGSVGLGRGEERSIGGISVLLVYGDEVGSPGKRGSSFPAWPIKISVTFTVSVFATSPAATLWGSVSFYGLHSSAIFFRFILSSKWLFCK